MLIGCDAVLFDSDGVLVDSDASVARAWLRWGRDFGIDHPDLVSIVHGRRAADTVAALVGPDRAAGALEAINRYEIEDVGLVTAIPGAGPLVRSIPAGRVAVVTSASGELVRVRLAAAGISPPAVLVSADDVEHGKPAPDGYLRAAEHLGCRPDRCIVVEDSASGVAAARAAGVLAVIGVSERALDTDADVVVADLTSLTWSGSAVHVDEETALRGQ